MNTKDKAYLESLPEYQYYIKLREVQEELLALLNNLSSEEDIMSSDTCS